MYRQGGRQQNTGKVKYKTNTEFNITPKETPDLNQKMYVLLFECINTKPGGHNNSRQAEQIKCATTLHMATYSSTLASVDQIFTV